VPSLCLLDADWMGECAVAVADAWLADTEAAFDQVAASYHQDNEDNVLLKAMRARVIATVLRHVPSGGRLLDLGCGPGTDVAVLARAGYQVTGVDRSPAMIREATMRAGTLAHASVRQLGIEDLGALAPETFQAALSNFGPLNCVPNLASAAPAIADRLESGGYLVASVIGRVCPWELALYVGRGQFGRAGIRRSRQPAAVPLSGHRVWTQYYSPREFAVIFGAAGFEVVERRALGLFTPPPYMNGFAGRHPGVISALQAVEDVAGAWPLIREWGDHFLIVLRKR
jgi:SAM-dependent methyltransferase